MTTMMTTTKEITNTEDVIDVRDVIARVEELEAELEDVSDDELITEYQEEKLELSTLTELLDDLRGNGGDEQWRGDWYPITLVRDSYFKDFAQQEAEDLDLVPTDHKWPTYCIDWDRAARELQSDYSEVEFDGVTYWYR